ncbi:PQQ-dependent sugar dehydrogenase [Microlunatus flavus]|uniref:Glucose/arabinose dehydrogenase, beta-propeller fold n=1 Tax=Microlunatus flavus TaxID=1036181 RepID=A0A1H9H8T7_9ACTN|nr:PQQ-dependent sugar dehydrogenase [Microlunatus flavus]SEQ58730.1 Glucose/arabinose dehydrogenase, beta-propeller fold [Microlunatus flavus]
MHLPRRSPAPTAAWLLAALVLLTTLAAPGPAAAAEVGAPVVSRGSGRCLTPAQGSDAPTTPLVVENCDGRAGQRWAYADPDGDGVGVLTGFGGTRCLDGRTLQAGLRLVVEPCTGAASQAVRVQPVTGALAVGGTSRCATLRGSAPAAGTPVELQPCTGTLDRLWRSSAFPQVTEPPGAPDDLTVSELTCRRVTLHWRDGLQSDGRTARWADVYHDGQLITSVAGSPERQSLRFDVRPGVPWGLYVNDRDEAGLVSQASATLAITPPACAPDTTPPNAPTSLTAAVVGGTAVRLRWQPSFDASGVRYYLVQRDGVTVGRLTGVEDGPTETTFLDSGVAAGSTHTYRVLARDPQLNTSPASAAVTVTVGTGCLVCSVRKVAHDDDLPWGLVALPDGTVLHARRDAAQLVRTDPATGRQSVVGTLPGVQGTDGEGGLMGLAVAPTFATDHWVYAMHSTATDNRVVRVRLVGSTLDAASEQVLLAGLPRNKFHDGGRLRFGPDGRLYVAVGDGQDQSSAQDLSVLGGKILRMEPDGTVPSDNPFGNYVWSFGHRNPQGLAFDAQGRLWEQEFGNSAMDETNLVVKGGNYGWPRCEGTVGRCSESWLVAPKKTYATHLGSCSGIAAVREVLYVGCLRGQRLYRIPVEGSSLGTPTAYLAGTYGRLRTVEPDRSGHGLWVTTSTKGDKDSVSGNSDEWLLHVGLDGRPG